MDKICGDKSIGGGWINNKIDIIKYNQQLMNKDRIFDSLNANDYRELKELP
jgi:hypothetical protein